MPLGDTTATWDRPDDENDDLEDDVEDEPEARPRPTAGSRAVFVARATRIVSERVARQVRKTALDN